MKASIWLPSALALSLFSVSCSNQKTNEPDPWGTGPFDANGTYREDWVSDPTKWTKPGQRPKADESFAANEQPPESATPIASKSTSTSKSTGSTVKSSDSSKKSTTSTKSADKKSTSSTKSTTSKSSTSKSSTKSSSSKTTTTKKPSSTTYTVKSGDSIPKIASRYGTSASAIMKANGLKKDLIKPGQKLTIPKK